MTTGLIVGRPNQRKPTVAEAVKLLQLNFAPEAGETVEISEEKPIYLGKIRSVERRNSRLKRLQLIAEWAERLYARTETWKGSLGTELAYLFAAIARGRHIALTQRSSLVRLLRREQVSPGNRIWKHIVIEGTSRRQ